MDCRNAGCQIAGYQNAGDRAAGRQLSSRPGLSPVAALLAALLAFCVANPAAAQLNDILSGKRLQPAGGSLLGGEKDGPKFAARADILPAEAGQKPRLAITVEIEPGWHTYSIHQAPGGPLPTKLNLDPSNDYRLAGPFVATPPAQKHSYPDIWPRVTVEEHSGRVTWQAPLDLAPGVELSQLQIRGTVSAQTCDADTCLPPASQNFTAALARPRTSAPPNSRPTAGGDAALLDPLADEFPQAATPNYRRGHATVRGQLDPVSVALGGKTRLILSATPDIAWHVYALADRDASEGSKPTLIQFAPVDGLKFGRAQASQEPTVGPAEDGKIGYFEREVRWTIEIDISREATPGDYPLTGLIGFQTCKKGSCDPPAGARFGVTLHVGAAKAGEAAITFIPAKYEEVARIAATALPPGGYQVANSGASLASLPLMILFSLVGGLLLNLMPCVLPVIGLKVLAFVEQAGQNRRRVLLLNLWYVAGMLAVFMALATLAVTLNFGWGEQFGSTGFTITMCALVFAMALSFLGVWEIPIPGFVGSGSAANLTARQGATGAFAKGVFTTVLATPCSGPFLGSVFGFTLQQPPFVTYLIFMSIGLGMASPYILIGAYPHLVSFLPKPGAWMETFKQTMAFLLLGTVVFMFSFMDSTYVVPTFALLIGIWAACWWIGRVPFTVSTKRAGACLARGGRHGRGGRLVRLYVPGSARFIAAVDALLAADAAEPDLAGQDRDGRVHGQVVLQLPLEHADCHRH